MATPRMDITSFVGKLLERDDVDALREGVRVLAQIVMGTEVRRDRRRPLRTKPRPRRLSKRLPAPAAGTPEPARSSSRSRSSLPVPTSPRCWSRVGGRRRHCTRSSWRPK